MSALQSFCHYLGLNSEKLSKEERLIFEAEIFIRVIQEIKEVFREEYQLYFTLMNFNKEMENAMLEENLLRLIIRDILATEEYTVEGIARYTLQHPDVIYKVLLGQNQNSSAKFFKRILELHRSVRADLYKNIFHNITAFCLSF